MTSMFVRPSLHLGRRHILVVIVVLLLFAGATSISLGFGSGHVRVVDIAAPVVSSDGGLVVRDWQTHPASLREITSAAGFVLRQLPSSSALLETSHLAVGNVAPDGPLSTGAILDYRLTDGRSVTITEMPFSGTVAYMANTLGNSARSVTVHGNDGVLITAKVSTAFNGVQWVEEGYQYAIWSRTVAASELLVLADLLH